MRIEAKHGRHARVPAWLVCVVLTVGLACSRHTWRPENVMTWEGCCDGADACLELLQEGRGSDGEGRWLPPEQGCASWKLGRLGEAVIPRLIPLLNHPERRVRGGAAQALANMRKKAGAAVPALIDAYVREPGGMALQALSSIDDPRAGPAIVRHLEESPISTLELLGPKLAVSLVEVLENPDSSWQALVRARYVLARRGYSHRQPFVPRLRALLARELESAVLRRPPGLSCPTAPAPSCEAVFDACTPRAAYVVSILAAAGEAGADAAPEVLQALRREDVRLTPVALQALVAFRDPAAVPPVLQQLAQSDCRARALKSLASLGPVARPGATEPLLHLLASEEEGWVRARAAEALGRQGDLAAVELLRQALRSPHSEVQGAAAQALGRDAFRAQAGELVPLLQQVATTQTSTSPVVRNNATRSLQVLRAEPVMLGAPRSCPPLERMGSEEWPLASDDVSLMMHSMDEKPPSPKGPCVGVPGADSASVLEPMGEACLVGQDIGEFGGSLEVYEKGRVTVLEEPNSNPLFVARMNGVLVVAEGFVHLFGGAGRLVRIESSEGMWRATPWVELPGAPVAHTLNFAGDLVVATMNQRLDEIVCGRADASADVYVLRVTKDGSLSPMK